MQSVIEITTPVCRTPAEVRPPTPAPWLRLEDRRAGRVPLRGAGTHPFSLFERQRITAKDRYRTPRRPAPVHRATRADLRDAHPRGGRRRGEGDPGHQRADPPPAGVPGAVGELAVLARRADRPPPRRGRWSSRPSTLGVPPRFESYGDFAEVVGQLERTGCIADYTNIWWDIRPPPKLRHRRAADLRRGRPVDDAVALAAYYQRSSKMLCEHVESAARGADLHRILTTENKWLAARHGLQAPVIEPGDRAAQPRPDHQLVRARCATSSRMRASWAGSAELEGLSEIVSRGNGAEPSSASGTRIATSSRSSRTSPPRRALAACRRL